MQDGTPHQIGDELEFQEAAFELALIPAARKGFGQPFRHGLAGAVLENDARKGTEPAPRVTGPHGVPEQGGGGERQKPLEFGTEPLVERLLGIRHPGRQANDGGDAFQGEDGFGTQRNQGGQQGGDGDLARGAFEKARNPREGFGRQLIQLGADRLEEGGEHHVRRKL